jgi:hypothetical protein
MLSAASGIAFLLIATGAAFQRANSEYRSLGWLAVLAGVFIWLFASKPHQVSLSIDNGELSVGTTYRLRLADCGASFGRYSYPSAGTLGTILWLGDGRRRVRIAGMNVLLNDAAYSQADSVRLDYTMQSDAFREFVGVLARHVPSASLSEHTTSHDDTLLLKLASTSVFGVLLGVPRTRKLWLTGNQLRIENSRRALPAISVSLHKVAITYGWWQLSTRYGTFQYPIMNLEAPGLSRLEIGSSGGWRVDNKPLAAKRQSAPTLRLGMSEWRILARRLNTNADSVFPLIEQNYGKG